MNENEEEPFDLCIIDADSIIYQIAYTTPSPNQAKKLFNNFIDDIINHVVANEAMVFIKGKDNFRFEADAQYKGNRIDTIEPEIKERIDKLYVHAREVCIESHLGEADDYCTIEAALCRDRNLSYIIAHIDKDLNCIPGYHYNFKKKEIYEVSNEEGYRFAIKQVLTGDNTDNIKGLKGIGDKKAEKMMEGVPSHRLLSTVLHAYGVNGREDFIKTANCILMRELESDLRPLSFSELVERLTWKTMVTGLPPVSDLTEPSGLTTTSKTDVQDEDTLEESN